MESSELNALLNRLEHNFDEYDERTSSGTSPKFNINHIILNFPFSLAYHCYKYCFDSEILGYVIFLLLLSSIFELFKLIFQIIFFFK